MRPRTVPHNRGFTLIEVLIATVLVVMVVSVVYLSFSTVVTSTEEGRRAADALRMQDFLTRSLSQNLDGAAEGWLPGAAARPAADVQEADTGEGIVPDGTVGRYGLIGTDGFSGDDAADTLTFATSAPLPGGRSLPGYLKQVEYLVESEFDDDGRDETFRTPRVLRVRETPIVGHPDDFYGTPSSGGQLGLVTRAPVSGSEGSEWSMDVESVNFRYFDGKKWRDEWDSALEGHLPWAVEIRVILPRPEQDDDQDNDEKVPDFFLILNLPAGAGIYDEPQQFTQKEES